MYIDNKNDKRWRNVINYISLYIIHITKRDIEYEALLTKGDSGIISTIRLNTIAG